MSRVRGATTLLGLTLLGVVLLGHFHLDSTDAPVQEATFNVRSEIAQRAEFSWDTVPTLKKLKWHACYGSDLQCARLEVPLNYSEPGGRKASIALVRKPATVPKKSYRGPVLFNPGGPGGSGVDLVVGGAALYSQILGPQFDIVGFDPRGVSRSTPAASFFKTNAERAVWYDNFQGLPIVNNTDEGVARTWARSSVVNQLAAESDDGYLRHLNTENTARDMLRIVQAHGRDKLQYWGFSYGSVLGVTFASLFPDKIERLVVDGVVDSESYYTTSWGNDLVDADKAMESFYTGCAAAGSGGCPFWAPTASQIKANLAELTNAIRAKPIPMRTKTGYGLFDYAKLRLVIFGSLYGPYEAFPVLALGLAELAAGNATRLFDRVNPAAFSCNCGTTSPDPPEYLLDASAAVLCNDGADVPGDLESAEKYFEEVIQTSEWYEMWASIRLGCVNWPKFPKDHFQGPFQGNTSHPILLIGNTADPVTPLEAAQKMSKGFKDAVVLTQDSVGHCSTSGPSVCTQKYVRDYFVDGTLPKPGTVCAPDILPFPATNEKALVSEMSVEDQEIYAAISALSQHSGVVGPINFNLKSTRATGRGCNPA